MIYLFVSSGIPVYVNVKLLLFRSRGRRRFELRSWTATAAHQSRAAFDAAHCHYLLVNQYESSHVCYNLKYFINVD